VTDVAKTVVRITREHATPFLAVRKGQDYRSIRALSEDEAAAYFDAAARLRTYERNAFPFKCAIRNYEDLVAARRHYTEGRGWVGDMPASRDVALHLNRLIMNYLASFRAFLDHAETRFKREFGAAEFEELKAIQRTQYDSSFSYRFVYNLRNYAQHCGLPMGNFLWEASEHPPRSKNVAYSMEISFLRDRLLEDWNDWRGNLKAEIAAKPAKWDVGEDLEAAMSGLTNVNATVARRTAASFRDAANLVVALRREISDPQVFVFVGTFKQLSAADEFSLGINELPLYIAENVLKELG
jgi:hypothetical protein